MAKSILAKTAMLILLVLLLAPGVYGEAKDPTVLPPEKVKKLSDQMDRTIDQYMGWLTQVYQMTPEQQEQARNRLQELKQEHLDYGKGAAGELLSLQQELRFYNEKARKNEPVDKQTIKDLQNRLTALMNKAPMTLNNVIVQTEKFLPDEQVQAGRERQKEFRARMDEYNKRNQRQSPPGPPGEFGPLKQYMDLDSPQAGQAPVPTPEAGTPHTTDTPAPKASAPTPPVPVVVEQVPLDAWGKYVEDFIAKYKLDEKQAQQSQLILGELRKRAEEYRLAHKPDYAAAEQIKEAPARKAEMDRLDKPIHEIFIELKTRLDGIPTDAQRKLVDSHSPASQSVKAPTTRPTAPVKARASAPASAPAKAVTPPK